MQKWFTAFEGKDSIKIFKHCSVTEKLYAVTAKIQDFTEWQNGKLAQFAFPELDNEQREFIISGTTPDEWKAWFSDD